MSETQTPEVPVDIPNYVVTSAPDYKISGVPYKAFRVAFGEPVRSALVRELDEADQWDLSEIGGANAENITWLSRAMAALAVIEVDGSPAIPVVVGKAMAPGIRARLRLLGRDGVMAVLRTLNQSVTTDDADPADVAKNS